MTFGLRLRFMFSAVFPASLVKSSETRLAVWKWNGSESRGFWENTFCGTWNSAWYRTGKNRWNRHKLRYFSFGTASFSRNETFFRRSGSARSCKRSQCTKTRVWKQRKSTYVTWWAPVLKTVAWRSPERPCWRSGRTSIRSLNEEVLSLQSTGK